MNDFLINGGIPVTLLSKMLTFGGSNESFKIDGDLLETMTIFNFNVYHSNPKDGKLLYAFGKEMNFNIKQKGRKSDWEKSLIKLLKSPDIMASGISTKFPPSDLKELCETWKFLLKEKQAGNKTDIFNDAIVAIVNKLLEYKWNKINKY